MQEIMGDTRKDWAVEMRGGSEKASWRRQHLNWGKELNTPHAGQGGKYNGLREDHLKQSGFVWLPPRFVLVVVLSIL